MRVRVSDAAVSHRLKEVVDLLKTLNDFQSKIEHRLQTIESGVPVRNDLLHPLEVIVEGFVPVPPVQEVRIVDGVVVTKMPPEPLQVTGRVLADIHGRVSADVAGEVAISKWPAQPVEVTGEVSSKILGRVSADVLGAVEVSRLPREPLAVVGRVQAEILGRVRADVDFPAELPVRVKATEVCQDVCIVNPDPVMVQQATVPPFPPSTPVYLIGSSGPLRVTNETTSGEPIPLLVKTS